MLTGVDAVYKPMPNTREHREHGSMRAYRTALAAAAAYRAYQVMATVPALQNRHHNTFLAQPNLAPRVH